MNQWLEPISTAVTGFGTIALCYFTFVLTRETRRLANTGEQPNIVVTFEPNRHVMFHLDLHVENTGTATAYDIRIAYSPEIKISHWDSKRRLPLQNISLLKPKQAVFSSLCDYGELETKSFTVTTSWSRQLSSGPREELSYSVDIGQMEGMRHLGSDPVIESAKAATKIAEGIERIAGGSKRIAVDTFNSTDRAEEDRLREEFYDRQIARRANPSAAPEAPPPEAPDTTSGG